MIKAWQFTSTNERDKFVLMFIIFAIINAIVHIFHGKIEAHPKVVLMILTGATGWLQGMVAYHWAANGIEQMKNGKVAQWISPLEFEDAHDRADTFAMLYSVASFGHVLWLFHDELSDDGIISIINISLNMVGSIITHYYKGKRKDE